MRQRLLGASCQNARRVPALNCYGKSLEQECCGSRFALDLRGAPSEFTNQLIALQDPTIPLFPLRRERIQQCQRDADTWRSCLFPPRLPMPPHRRSFLADETLRKCLHKSHPMLNCAPFSTEQRSLHPGIYHSICSV